MNSSAPIPAFVNARSGTAAKAISALRRDARFAIREVAPQDIAEAIHAEARKQTPRVLVCGGDGTIATALGAAAGTALDVAIFPSGTLNHFARDVGLPTDNPTVVLDIAAMGRTTPVDLGYVNGHVILNTSSVGSYVDFVRYREASREWLGYRMASLVAATRVWLRPRSIVAQVDSAGGGRHRFQTPLAFVAVGERTLGRAGLGARVAGGGRSLHVLVVKDRTRSRLGALAFGAVVQGLDEFVRDEEVESRFVSELTLVMQYKAGTIAIDGELVRVTSPLHYEFKHAAARMVGRR